MSLLLESERCELLVLDELSEIEWNTLVFRSVGLGGMNLPVVVGDYDFPKVLCPDFGISKRMSFGTCRIVFGVHLFVGLLKPDGRLYNRVQ